MFRIKTDIRHYRCDSPAKVERLIRNWVIRPSDLIYDDDHDRWRPIGNHQEFCALFESLEERHEDQPETLITDTDASAGADDGSGPTKAPRRTVAQQRPPKPADDVEGVVRDGDEITMMTERTLELISDDRHKTADAAIRGGDTELAGPDEPTGRIEQPDFDKHDGTADEAAPSADSNSAQPGSRGHRQQPGRDALPEELFVTAELDDDSDPSNDDSESQSGGDVMTSVEDSLLTAKPDGGHNWNIVVGNQSSTPPAGTNHHAAGHHSQAQKRTDEHSSRSSAVDATADETHSTDAYRAVDTEGESADSDIAVESIDDADIEPLEVDEEALDDAFDDLEDNAVEARQRDDGDSQPEELEEIDIEALHEAIPDGYEAEFLVPIKPSEQALQMGLQQTSASTAQQDRRYSRPQRKVAGRIIRKTYRLRPHPLLAYLPVVPDDIDIDRDLLITAGAIAVAIILLATALILAT